MGEVQEFFEFMEMIFNAVSFGVGAVIATIGTLVLTPVAFRLQRRWVLHRNWKADKPRQILEGLYPEWQDYDPDLPGISRRCVCHGRLLHPGERVLTWPETGPMNLLHVAVYCESEQERLWHAH